jgi:glycosyltransferase involved in cell wall biosynthesis
VNRRPVWRPIFEGIPNSVKINLATVPPLHIFDLAQQLEQMGHLNALYTVYPPWRVRNLPRQKVQSFPWFMGINEVRKRIVGSGFDQPMKQLVIHTFDRWVSQHMQPCDIFDCASSFGIASHRVARQTYRALSVCRRGSSHIRYQDRLLAEEYARWGLPYQRISAYIVARELEEYTTCDMIVVPSSFVYRSFIEQGVADEKLELLPYGVDVRLFKAVPKEDTVFRVLYVGALAIRKGIIYLLEALATLKLPNFELCLIGEMEDEIKPFLAKYEGGFRYLGKLPRQELYWYYSQSSVFVMPSIEEGLANVQPQAMACGLPIIATTNTGGEDVATDGVEGFIVPIRDPEAIREKVLYLYEHPGVQREMSQAALSRAQNVGGWDTYVKKLLEAYGRAFARRDNGEWVRS